MGFYSERVFPILLRRAVERYESDRDGLLEKARGRVLEIGVGGGQNLPRYGSEVREVTSVEISETLLEEARARVASQPPGAGSDTRFSFTAARAERLPFRDSTFHTAVSFLLFCSVDRPAPAAEEISRVLKPSGVLLFFEHVRARTAGWRTVQDLANPIWKRIACGCNLNRDTRGVFEEAGFEFLEIEDFEHEESVRLTSRKIRGVAAKPT